MVTHQTRTPARAPTLLYCITRKNRRRTYVGVTNDLKRRLRQHNGEIKGGAKATRGHSDWRALYTIRGFPDRTSALQWEWRLHQMGRRGKRAGCPCCRRLHALKVAWALARVTSKATPNSELRLRVRYHRRASACRHGTCQ